MSTESTAGQPATHQEQAAAISKRLRQLRRRLDRIAERMETGDLGFEECDAPDMNSTLARAHTKTQSHEA